MKRFLGIIMASAMVFVSAPVFAQEDFEKVTVNMNGTEMQFDVEPIIENDRTLVPFRAIFEALGCSVSYMNYDGVEAVSAHRGDDSLMLAIGGNKMFFGDEEIELDVPAKIVNDRTLVPLRAVSEAFDTEVIWYDNIKTVCLYPKQGAHRISPVTVSKEIKNDDGITLINVSYSYPVIENTENNPLIDKINAEYKENAENFAKAAEEEKAEAQTLYEQAVSTDLLPYERNLTYTVDADRMNLLSVTNHMYVYSGGAHGTMIKESRSFNMTSGTELKLSDILEDKSSDEINSFVYSEFEKYFTENYGEDYMENWSQQLKAELENVKFYLTDNSLTLYFDVYAVAPYAFGTPSIEIPYDENTFAVDLSDAKLDEYAFSLDGNPTTGYSWQIISVDNERLDVKEEYTENDNPSGLLGVGGKYTYTVKGLKPGNASLELAYIKAGESVNEAEKAFILDVYIDKDNKITVLNTYDDVEKVKIAPGM